MTNKVGFSDNKNLENSSSSTGNESRVQKTTSWINQGLGYAYQSVGSIANRAVAYLPMKGSQPTCIAKIDKLSEQNFTELLTFISSGETEFDTPQHRQLLQEIVNEWELVVNLCGSASPHPRLALIVGSSQKSPLVLFQLVHQFGQQNLWSYLKDDLIAWPSDNADEAVIRHGLVDGQWTDQFERDCSRSCYIVKYSENGKPVQKSFPVDYTGNKKDDLKSALLKFPVFKDQQGIPFPVQESLTQKTAMTYLTMGVWDQFSESSIPVPPPDCKRTFVIEEVNTTCFSLSIQERMTLGDGLYFDYSYIFKISKKSEGRWLTELVSLSFVQPKITGKDSDFLFGVCPISSATKSPYQFLFDTMVDQLQSNLEAVIKCQNLSPLHRIEEQVNKQWTTLITKFAPEFFQKSNRLQNLKDLFTKPTELREAKLLLTNFASKFAK